MSDTDQNTPMTVEEIVEWFLGVGYLLPEKPPKTQRAQMQNEMLVQGFARAQEQLRHALKQKGYDQLAETRHPESPRPITVGGLSVWAA